MNCIEPVHRIGPDKTLATVTLMQVAVANMSFIPKEEGALYFTRPR